MCPHSATISATSSLLSAVNSPRICWEPGNDLIHSLQCAHLLPNNQANCPPPLRAVYCALLLTGARVAAILRLCVSDCLPTGHIILPTTKRTHRITAYLPGLSALLATHPEALPSARLFPYTYTQLYSQASRAGLRLAAEGHRHALVFHAPRHILASEVSRVAGPDAAASALGHHSLSSVGYYTHTMEGHHG